MKKDGAVWTVLRAFRLLFFKRGSETIRDSDSILLSSVRGAYLFTIRVYGARGLCEERLPIFDRHLCSNLGLLLLIQWCRPSACLKVVGEEKRRNGGVNIFLFLSLLAAASCCKQQRTMSAHPATPSSADEEAARSTSTTAAVDIKTDCTSSYRVWWCTSRVQTPRGLSAIDFRRRRTVLTRTVTPPLEADDII